MNRFAFIMRGVSGSGKSSTAEAIASAGSVDSYIDDGVVYYTNEQGDVISAIHSTDNYFMKDGKYEFNRFMLGKNHSINFKKFKQSIALEIPIVICDNTNTMRKEFIKYLEAARRTGYITSVVALPHPPLAVAVERNSHGVPEEAIEKMIKRWEPYNGRKK